MQRRMEELEKQIRDDPYTALFGRRVDAFDIRDLGHRSWTDMWRAFLGHDIHGHMRDWKSSDTAASSNLKSKNTPASRQKGFRKGDKMPSSDASMGREVRSESQQTNAEVFEFDPISGRMVPVVDVTSRVVPPGGSDMKVKNKKEPVDTVRTIDSLVASSESTPQVDSVQMQRAKHLPESTLTPSSRSRYDIPSGERTHPFQNNSDEIQGEDSRPEALDQSSPRMVDALDMSQTSEDPAMFKSTRPENSRKPSILSPSQRYDNLLGDLQRREKNEDLDLLQASDIRATYNSKKAKQELDARKGHRRKALEEDFESHRMSANDTLDEEILEDIKGRRRLKSVGEKSEKSYSQSETHQPLVESLVTSSEGQLKSENDAKLDRDQSHQPAIQTENMVSLHHDNQPPGDASASVVPGEIATYRVLAYDSSTLKVTTAETTSSLHAAETTHPAEILSRLNNPAKFLPYFAEMERDGYDIVSGGGDILVFEKVRGRRNTVDAPAGSPVATATLEEPTSLHDSEHLPAEAVKGESRYEPKFSSKDTEKEAPSTNQAPRIVRRQEVVYTGGPPNWSPWPPSPAPPDEAITEPQPSQQNEGRFRRAVRRMLLAGTATAATCYAVGAVCEFFRTGGEDGRGFDAFTEFESERRQNERR